jgi:hypothetical protein
MDNINEDGIIRIIMLYLDFETCCKNSSLLNFALTNRKYMGLMSKLNKHSKIKYYKLSYKFQHKLNSKYNNICIKCNNLFNYKIETLIRIYKKSWNYNPVNFACMPIAKSSIYREFIHFNSNEMCKLFVKKTKLLFPNVKLFGSNCCSGKGIEIYLKIEK